MNSKPVFSKIILILSFFIIGYVKAQGPAFNYAKQIGNSGNDAGKSIATDNSGNVYVTGWFSGITDFDPSAATYTLSSFGITDVFVAKYSSVGNFLWVKQIGGTSDDLSSAIALDNNNNIYVTGTFIGTCDFDPSGSTFNLTSVGGTQEDAFFLKLDPTGNFLWANQIGSTLPDYSSAVAIDASNNCYFTGRFNGTVDFDSSPSTFTLSAITQECYVLKLNTNGNFVWAKSFDFTVGSGNRGNSITIDILGNVLTTGYFYGTTDFDPGAATYTLTSTGQQDVFISKLDNSGNFVWAKSFSGTADEEAYSISSDNDGNVYTTGTFKNTVDFDPSAGVFSLSSTSPGAYGDVFVSKLDKQGNFKWAKQIGGNSSMNVGYSIAIDNSSSVFITGMFNGTVDFDPGAATFSVTSLASDNDIFVTKLDSLGSFLWAKTMQGTMDDKAYAVTLDNSGSVYLTGSFNGTVDFDPSASTYTLTNPSATGIPDAFIVKLSCQSPTINATASSSAICNGSSVTLNASGASTYTWNPSNLNGSSATVSPTLNTTYTVIGVDAGSCSNSATISVTVNSVPTLTASISSSVICNGNSSILSVSGASTYTWNPGSLSGSSVTISPTSNTTYTVIGVDGNDCSNSATKSVTVNPIPTLTTSSSSSVICNGNTVTLNVAGASTYTWNPGNLSGASVTVSPTSNITYSVIGATANGCSSSATKSVTVNSVPVMTTSLTNVNCNGNANGSIIVNVSGGTIPYSYLWSNGNSSSQSNTLTAGNYSIQVSDLNNCSTNTIVTLSEPSQLTANVSVVTPSCIGISDGSAQLNIIGGISPYTILWSNGVTSTQNNNLSANVYSVSINDANACTYTLNVIISDASTSCFFIPNGFSPNGDGINDTWEIPGINNYPNAQVTVLNRWGQEMLNTNNYTTPWDGSFKGGLLPTSDYYYIINLNDGSKALTGTLTIKR
jgi:gliding motility-associated-like protein